MIIIAIKSCYDDLRRILYFLVSPISIKMRNLFPVIYYMHLGGLPKLLKPSVLDTESNGFGGAYGRSLMVLPYFVAMCKSLVKHLQP